MKLKDITLATSMLSFSRSIQTSSGLFRAWNSETPDEKRYVRVEERHGLGQVAHHSNNEGDKLLAEVSGDKMSNPVSGDAAEVPVGCDRLGLSFTVRCLPYAGAPHSSNSVEVSKSFREVVQRYEEVGGLKYLAALYLENIANARFAFRNLFVVDEAEVTIGFDDEKLVFDPFAFALNEPAQDITYDEQIAILAAGLKEGDRDLLEELIENMADGLSEGSASTLHVNFVGHVNELEEVFPSQEFKEGRVLSSVAVVESGENVRAATMHPEKLGNAIRTIDRWHGAEGYTAQPVNPYAGVKADKAALRAGKSAPSLYDIMKKPQDHLKSLFDGDQPSPEAHFLVANLIRGGVFGISGKLSSKQQKKLKEDAAKAKEAA